MTAIKMIVEQLEKDIEGLEKEPWKSKEAAGFFLSGPSKGGPDERKFPVYHY